MDNNKYFVYVSFNHGKRQKYTFSSLSSAYQFIEVAKREGVKSVSKPLIMSEDEIFSRGLEI